MECRVNGNNIKRGMTSLIKKDLLGSDIFTEKEGNFVVKPSQYFQAQSFAEGINNKFGREVIKRLSDNNYSISIPDDILKDYIVKTKEGKDLVEVIGLNFNFGFEKASWNRDEMFTYLNYPEITEMTNEKLKSFLKSLNPDFKVEEIDNLSVEGVAYVKDFLIQVRTVSKLKAMPEEVAHIFRMMLPDDNPLKQEMFDNITSYPIYGQTLAKYKELYLTEEGKPDYDKIKWEAADKLVAEYVTALSTGDRSRVDTLGKPRQSFLQRWWAKFLKWLGLGMRDHTTAYADIAGIILSGENTQDIKSMREIADISYTDSYFFRASEEQLYDMVADIMEKLTKENHPELLKIVTTFAKQFGKKFKEILDNEEFEELNRELKRNETTGDIGQINALSEIKSKLNDAGFGMKEAMDSEAFVIGVKQFLEAVDRLGILSDGILRVIKNKEKAKEFDEAIKNIKELETYFGIYETFINTISSDLVDTLIKSGVGGDVIRTILTTQTNFEEVNRYILNRQRDDLLIFFHHMFEGMNKSAAAILQDDLKRELAKSSPKPQIIEFIKKRLTGLIVTDEQIINMLSGKGKDIDPTSVMNHLLNAAVINGDPYVAGVAKYIANVINRHQQKAKVDVNNLMEFIDPIQKELGEQAYVTGKNISYVEQVPDWESETGTRDVLTYLNPWKGIFMARDNFRKKLNVAYDDFKGADKNSPERDAYFSVYKEIQTDYEQFLAKYMNRPFVKEYYEFRKKYDADPLFVEVMGEWQEKTKDINGIEERLAIEPEDDEGWDELAILKRERSRLINEFDNEGNPKSEKDIEKAKILKLYFDESAKYKEIDDVQTELSYNVARNRYMQKLDFAIQDIRKFNLKDIREIEKRLREVMQNKRIRIADAYEMAASGEMAEEGTVLGDYEFVKGIINYDFIKDLLMDKWYQRNITITANQAFKDYEQEILAKIKELEARGELTEAEEDLAEAYKERANILQGSRDEIGQINPASLTQEEKDYLLELDDLIDELKKARPSPATDLSAMSPEDRQKWSELDAIILDPATKLGKKRDAIIKKNKLKKKYRNVGKGKTINDLWAELGSLAVRRATQYYWDKMEELIPHISEYVKYVNSLGTDEEDKKALRQFEKDFVFAIDEQNWEELDFNIMTKGDFLDFINWLKESGRITVYEWFTDNHQEKSVFDSETGKYTKLPFVRSTIYNQRIPILPEHQKIVYNKRFVRNKVKDEYRTGYNPDTKKVELKVGVHITNRETNEGYSEFLPLSPEQGEPSNSPYRNEAYYKLKNATDGKDKLRFQYLQILVDAHLKSQEKIPARKRTWMNVPVAGLSNIESVLHIPTKVNEQIDILKSAFKKNEAGTAAAQAEGIDTVVDEDTLQSDTEDDQGDIVNEKIRKIIEEKIPKIGMSQRLPINRISTDLLKSQAEFIMKAYEFEARLDSQALPKALIRVMKNNEYKGNNSNKARADIFEKMYRQMILEEVPEETINSPKMRRVARFLTGNTALRMLADLPGATVNYISAMVNDIIEASAGKYVNLRELAKGKVLAAKVDAALMADFNKKSDLSYYTLLFQFVDLLQGDFAEDMLDRSSSLDKWSSIKQILMIPRKAGELFAQTAVGMAMMERHKVVNSMDGKSYPMHEIFKKKGNILVLKEGFPAEYDPVTGEKFFKIKEIINRVNLELHGNYAKISQSQASRYAIGKLAENMKRWFMPAIQRRFGRETMDITFEEPTEGYYRTAARAGYNYFSALFHLDVSLANSWMSYFMNTPRYQQNLRRFAAEMAQAFLLFLTFAILLGYSGDDKNKQLANNSWIHNMAILVSLRAYSETTAYIPFPPFGFQEMKRNVLAPFSLPADAVSNFAAIAELGIYQIGYWFGIPTVLGQDLKSQLYYQKDSGYWYTNKGHSKLLKYMLRSIGYTGYTQEPEQYIKMFNSLQQRLK